MKQKFTAGEWSVVILVGVLVFAALFSLAGCVCTLAVYLVCDYLLPVFGVQIELATYQYWQTGFIICFLMTLFNANRIRGDFSK